MFPTIFGPLKSKAYIFSMKKASLISNFQSKNKSRKNRVILWLTAFYNLEQVKWIVKL